MISFNNQIADKDQQERFKKISHGLGLKIIQHIAFRLGFEVNCSVKNNIFEVNLFIPNKNINSN